MVKTPLNSRNWVIENLGDLDFPLNMISKYTLYVWYAVGQVWGLLWPPRVATQRTLGLHPSSPASPLVLILDGNSRSAPLLPSLSLGTYIRW